tara:strand:+ start:808 stop:1041 length:234 start_codon:yes stop_codon:yes gene_type:complete
MATRKFNRKSTKTQKAGRRNKKFSSKRKGGLLETIATAIVPFGLVAAKRSYSRRVKKSSGKSGRKMKKKFRSMRRRR